MATYVADTLNRIDRGIAGYTEAVFADLAGPITTTCQVMGLVGLAFMAINALTQWVPIRVDEYIRWGVRFVVITAVATSWAQFQPIYDIVTNIPADIGGNFLTAAGVGNAANLYDGLDLMITELFAFSDRAADQSSYFSISLASIVIWLAGALMAVAAILVAALGKVGLAMAISLAPVFIPTLLFRSTGNLFESWVRFTIGFALIPLVLGGIIGTILGIGKTLARDAQDASALVEGAGFLIVAAAAIFLMAQVPTLVNGLSGSIVATANGVAQAQSGGQTGGRVAGGSYRVGAGAVRAAGPRTMQARSALDTALRTSGGEGPWRMQQMLKDAKETSAARKRGAERIGQRNAEMGRRTSVSERREAAAAAMTEQARENMRQRRGGTAPRDAVDRTSRPKKTDE